MISPIIRIVIVSRATLKLLYVSCKAKFTYRNRRLLDAETRETYYKFRKTRRIYI